MNTYTFILPGGESLTIKGDYTESSQFGARVYVDKSIVGIVPRFIAMTTKAASQGCRCCKP